MENGRMSKYINALEAVKAHRFKDAFELYCSLFLPLGKRSREFLAFYRYQLSCYLSEKKSYCLGLGEGDMISDLIGMTYDEVVDSIENSDIPVTYSGRINILESVEIPFPCQKETKVDEPGKCVAK